jgi:hypothetical protein
VAENTARKQRGRPFEQGESGNPSGKPKGARHRTTLVIEKLLEGEAEEIGRKAIELAKSGDTVALRLCLERVAPVRKGRPISLALPSMNTPADVTAAMSAIITQMARASFRPRKQR